MIGSRVARVALAGPRPVRQVAAGADVMIGAGPLYMLERKRAQRARARLGDRPPDALYREIWSGAARTVGADVAVADDGRITLTRAGKGVDVRWHLVGLDDQAALGVALDKELTSRLLDSLGLPVVPYELVSTADLDRAERFLDSMPGPCVVKPARGTSGGGGVTTGVSSRGELWRALLRASRAEGRILVEAQVPGDSYRLLVLDGELLDVVVRYPPALEGDGVSSIRRLIDTENRRRLAGEGRCGFVLLTVDLDALLALGRQEMSLRSVPTQGSRVEVKGAVSQNRPEDNRTVRDPVHPELVEQSVAAARALGLRLAGIDVVTRDPGRPLAETGGAIVEVNGTPGLHYHYLVADPERGTPVAAPILDRLLDADAHRDARGPPVSTT